MPSKRLVFEIDHSTQEHTEKYPIFLSGGDRVKDPVFWSIAQTLGTLFNEVRLELFELYCENKARKAKIEISPIIGQDSHSMRLGLEAILSWNEYGDDANKEE